MSDTLFSILPDDVVPPDNIASIKRTLNEQADALHKLAAHIDPAHYQKALALMSQCKGHVILSGMGKSGHVGRKMSATLASTGTPSFFIHPAEAFHGDLGMITPYDLLILISASGETDEILKLIPSLKAKKIDAIISSLSITEKRQQEIAFSEKLYAADSRLIAAKGSPIQPTIDSLKGKHVGVLQGSTQEGYANANWREKGVDVVAYQNQDLIYSDLAAGRLDAAFQDEVAASEGFLKQSAGKEYAFAGPSVKDKKYFGDGTGIGLRKDDTELKAAFDKAFNELRKDGTYDKLAKKYFDFNVYGD